MSTSSNKFALRKSFLLRNRGCQSRRGSNPDRHWEKAAALASLSDLLDTIQHLEACGVDLYLDQQAIDTTTPMGKLVFRVAGAFAEFERTMIPPTNQSRSQARRCSGREARPAEDRQRDRTKGAKAACERCGYLEGGKVSQHRDWHGPAHLKRARLKEATYFVLSPSFMRAPGRGNFSISNFHPRAPQIDVATVLIRMVHRALPAHQ